MNAMNCLEFRNIVGAEPGNRDKAVLAHRLACTACNEHAQRLLAADQRLREAMQVDVPDRLAARVMLRKAFANRRRGPWLAAAATVLLGIGVASVFVKQQSDIPLDAEVIEHIHHEPHLLLETDTTVDDARLQKVLFQGGAGLSGEIGELSFAKLCPFRGRLVAHLVMRGENGPITLLLLPNVQVSGPMPVNEEGFEGVILPLESGSVAVVGVTGEPLESVEYRVKQRVYWGT